MIRFGIFYTALLVTHLSINAGIKLGFLGNMSNKAKWYMIHSLTNVVVAGWTLPAVYLMMTEYEDFTWDSTVPSLLVMALHIFHALHYKMSTDDIIHHSVMLTVLLVPLLNPNSMYLSIANFSLFFLCGLPGAIDYFLMFKVETGQMQKIVEKRYNVMLNTWIRAPGILFGASRCYLLLLKTAVPAYVCLPVITALLWNAQYYSSQVSQSYGRHQREEKSFFFT